MELDEDLSGNLWLQGYLETCYYFLAYCETTFKSGYGLMLKVLQIFLKVSINFHFHSWQL